MSLALNDTSKQNIVPYVTVESLCELAKASNETGCVTTAKNADFQPKSWHFLKTVEDRYTVTMEDLIRNHIRAFN